MKQLNNIVVLGAGHVAWHLTQQLSKKGYSISFVWSRTATNAKALAMQLGCRGSHHLTDIPTHADLYLIIVSDHAITDLCKQLQTHIDCRSLVMHTSGATPSAVIAPFFDRHGVFYPLQSFSKNRDIPFDDIPLCLYTSEPTDFTLVQTLAQGLSKNVHYVDDLQRSQLHLSAVFVNNFTNYLQHIATSLTEEHHLPAQLLQPLLKETINKLGDLSPAQAQTGPAIRGDQNTIDRHMNMLNEHPHWQMIYQLLSTHIRTDLVSKD